jgi:hypothetical protein
MNSEIDNIVFQSCFLPAFALFFCVVYPLVTNFDNVTATHCADIINILPSVSAAIGNSGTTVLMWLIIILMHTPARFKLARRLNKTYKTIFAQIYTPEYIISLKKNELKRFYRIKYFTKLSYCCNKFEIYGLIILTLFTSNSNYGIL